jgi:hypothetical protein
MPIAEALDGDAHGFSAPSEMSRPSVFPEHPMAQAASTPHFATQSRTVLSGSEKRPAAQPAAKRSAPQDEEVTVSVIVRRKKPQITRLILPP